MYPRSVVVDHKPNRAGPVAGGKDNPSLRPLRCILSKTAQNLGQILRVHVDRQVRRDRDFEIEGPTGR